MLSLQQAIGLRVRGRGAPVALFSPASLFAASEVGVWYDPSDFSTLFENTDGTGAISTVEKPVGLMLDKSQGLTLGSELVTNGGPFTVTTGWNAYSGGILSVDSARLKIAGSPGDITYGATQTLTTQSGAWYKVTITVSSANTVYIRVGTTGGGSLDNLNFSKTPVGTDTIVAYFLATSTTTSITLQGFVDTDSFWSSISVKQIAGNHAVAANNSTARPVLRSRYNLLTYSQAAFSNAAWSKTRTSIGSETITAPDSTSTASVLIEDTATGSHSTSQTNTMIAGASYVASVYAKDVDGQYLIISAANTTNASLYARAAFDLSVGTVANTAEAGTGYSVTQATIASVGSGWYRCTLKFVAGSTAPGSVFLGMSNTSSPGAYGLASYTGTSRSIYIWGAQLVANSVFPANTYQRIAAATDYDTDATKFPPYLAFTTDDAMSTASIDFSGTDEMTVFAGVTKNADSGTVVISELSASSSSNSGSFAVFGSVVGGDKYRYRSGGSAYFDAVTASSVYSAPTTNVLTGLSDISLDSVVLRLDGSEIDANTGDQGSGNYGNYPLYIGARGGSSLFFNGSLYSLIVRGKTSTSTEIQSTENYVAGKLGRSITWGYDYLVDDAGNFITTDGGDQIYVAETVTFT